MSARRRGLAALAAATTAALVAAPGAAGAPEARRTPRANYAIHCRGCHLADGGGLPGRAPSLHETTRLLVAPRGRAYLARVPGVAQAPLDDAALAALLNWTLAAFGRAPLPEGFEPYDAAEVGRLRREPLADPLAARRALEAALAERAGAGGGPR